MQDFVSNNTGNSRFLKSVSTFLADYPTYEDFAAALVSGTLPVDFNGVNDSGITQRGTPYNKANVLTDATAALYGLGTNANVNDVLGKIGNVELGGTNNFHFEWGVYAGDGRHGEGNYTTFRLMGTPRFGIIWGGEGNGSSNICLVSTLAPIAFIDGTAYMVHPTTDYYEDYEEYGISWLRESDKAARIQMNANNKTYFYVFFTGELHGSLSGQKKMNIFSKDVT